VHPPLIHTNPFTGRLYTRVSITKERSDIEQPVAKEKDEQEKPFSAKKVFPGPFPKTVHHGTALSRRRP
jgi:hypothetical protein